MKGTAIDERYRGLFVDIQQPSEYDIQANSGVYDTLVGMPYYNDLMPDSIQ